MFRMPNKEPKTLRSGLLIQRAAYAKSKAGIATSQSITTKLRDALQTELRSIQTIALYWPIQNEIDLRSTLVEWAKAGYNKQLALPVMQADKQLDFFLWRDGEPLVTQQHGILEPNPEGPNAIPIQPDCILIPCLGWSWDTNRHRDAQHQQFWRLGYGGGYFDRTLAKLRTAKPTTMCIGVAYDWQQLGSAEWQPEAHDEPLDAMLTESGLRLKGD
jgi:5,10-methenyltetrahydrofolate synthetase